ncbi:MAG: diguanylate cyclase [Candidatus Thiodiazotropha sp.]
MNDKDWKRLYEELLRRHEDETAACRELELLLRRTISRLTLAVDGLDERLDTHLKSIRRAVKSGDGATLKARLTALSDGLLHPVEAPENGDSEPDYAQLLTPLALSTKDAAEAERLLRLLSENPSDMDSARFAHLARLLGQNPASGRKSGLFDRLLGAVVGEGEDAPKPNDILLNLLEQATWPGHWGERISEFKRRLSPQSPEDAWTGVLQDLLQLSARSFGEFQTEIKQAEDFLEELSKRLQDLGLHLQSAHEGRDLIVEHGRSLSAQVNGHVGDLGNRVAQAVDLQQLKSAVNERLSLIQRGIDAYLQEEIEWHRRAEEGETVLRQRLEQLEKESYDLRTRMLEAHHLALLDTVTGLPNRLAYEERITQEFARWKRFGDPLSMLIWDVDDFKSINDRFGHQAGDKALRVIAQSLQARLRETDFIARFGGEEFVCLLCGSGGDEALKVADEMRRSVADNGFHSSGKPVAVTISCGIADFRQDDTVDAVFSRADKALYAAKKSGKNRCERV